MQNMRCERVNPRLDETPRLRQRQPGGRGVQRTVLSSPKQVQGSEGCRYSYTPLYFAKARRSSRRKHRYLCIHFATHADTTRRRGSAKKPWRGNTFTTRTFCRSLARRSPRIDYALFRSGWIKGTSLSTSNRRKTSR